MVGPKELLHNCSQHRLLEMKLNILPSHTYLGQIQPPFFEPEETVETREGFQLTLRALRGRWTGLAFLGYQLGDRRMQVNISLHSLKALISRFNKQDKVIFISVATILVKLCSFLTSSTDDIRCKYNCHQIL